MKIDSKLYTSVWDQCKKHATDCSSFKSRTVESINLYELPVGARLYYMSFIHIFTVRLAYFAK